MSRMQWQLLKAAGQGDVAALRVCLAAGADPNAADGGLGRMTPTLWGAARGQAACVDVLLAAGASPDTADALGWGALHHATNNGCEGSIPALLASGADAAGATTPRLLWTPLHCAARCGNAAAAALLLTAAPDAAACRDAHGKTPLALALAWRRMDVARCLLERAPLPPASDTLAVLSAAGKAMAPLYACLVARQALTAEEWDRVPSPCPSLRTVLPAVLQRSAAEAGALVRRLSPAEQQRLRTAALCLGRAQERLPVRLPTPLLWQVLSSVL